MLITKSVSTTDAPAPIAEAPATMSDDESTTDTSAPIDEAPAPMPDGDFTTDAPVPFTETLALIPYEETLTPHNQTISGMFNTT